MDKYHWERTWLIANDSLECSSKGDKRLSAFYAVMPDGRTIEQHYQCDIKGYDIGGTNWKLGKGNPPLKRQTVGELYQKYYMLWETYLNNNPNIVLDIQSTGKTVMTDMYASTPVNQARAIADYMNKFLEKTNKTATDTQGHI